jgi:hypothetical protein
MASASFPISPQQHEAGFPFVEYHAEVASSVFKAGAPLVRDANGFMAECGAAPALIYGFAVNDGQNLASSGLNGDSCAVYRAKPGTKFEGQLIGTLTQTMEGENYGLVKNGTTLYWEIIPADAGDQIEVVGHSSRMPIGTVDPIVDFTVDAANIQEG